MDGMKIRQLVSNRSGEELVPGLSWPVILES
jgi:hypothetical protein